MCFAAFLLLPKGCSPLFLERRPLFSFLTHFSASIERFSLLLVFFSYSPRIEAPDPFLLLDEVGCLNFPLFLPALPDYAVFFFFCSALLFSVSEDRGPY